MQEGRYRSRLPIELFLVPPAILVRGSNVVIFAATMQQQQKPRSKYTTRRRRGQEGSSQVHPIKTAAGAADCLVDCWPTTSSSAGCVTATDIKTDNREIPLRVLVAWFGPNFSSFPFRQLHGPGRQSCLNGNIYIIFCLTGCPFVKGARPPCLGRVAAAQRLEFTHYYSALTPSRLAHSPLLAQMDSYAECTCTIVDMGARKRASKSTP
jgi:hypothetical protein